MKLSFSNIGWTKEQDDVVYKILKEYGFSGVEIAPTRIVEKAPYDNVDSAVQWEAVIQDRYGFCVPSMQSIWYGRQEKIFGTEDEREVLVEYTKKAILYAEAMNIENLVFGCPRNRSVDVNTDLQIGIDFFKAIGDYAAEHHTVIAMEANPVIYNTNYANFTKDAFKLVDKVSSKGFKVNLDLGTMIYNEESPEILKGKVDKINHVHISEPGLTVMQKRELHKEIIDILAEEKYDRFVSVEMGKQESLDVIKNTCEYVAGLVK